MLFLAMYTFVIVTWRDTCRVLSSCLPDTFSSVEHVLSEKNKKNMERQQVTDNLVLRRPALYKKNSEVEIIYTYILKQTQT